MVDVLVRAKENVEYDGPVPPCEALVSSGERYAVVYRRRHGMAQYEYWFQVLDRDEVVLETRPARVSFWARVLRECRSVVTWRGEELFSVTYEPYKLNDVLTFDGRRYRFPTVGEPRVPGLPLSFPVLHQCTRCHSDDERMVMLALGLTVCLWLKNWEEAPLVRVGGYGR